MSRLLDRQMMDGYIIGRSTATGPGQNKAQFSTRVPHIVSSHVQVPFKSSLVFRMFTMLFAVVFTRPLPKTLVFTQF